MATPNYTLVHAFKKAAQQLKNGQPYQWGHMGSCNCGHLAQVLLNLNKGSIHQLAMEKVGDWNEQLNDYCPTSGLAMDQLIWGLLEKGLSQTDLMDLEYLRNTSVLAKINDSYKPLLHNKREHVILYLEAWATLMEDELISGIYLKTETKKTADIVI
jgi:hypothetical protein